MDRVVWLLWQSMTSVHIEYTYVFDKIMSSHVRRVDPVDEFGPVTECNLYKYNKILPWNCVNCYISVKK